MCLRSRLRTGEGLFIDNHSAQICTSLSCLHLFVQDCKSMLTFVISEKTGDVMMSFAEGNFTLSQVGHIHKDQLKHSICSLLFFMALDHKFIAAPTGTGDSKECEQERNIILQRSYQEETLKGMTQTSMISLLQLEIFGTLVNTFGCKKTQPF